MKIIINLLICLLFWGVAGSQTIKIYIVRHAEKSTEPANNPHLKSEGMQRANALKDLLKNKNIGYLFSTNTNRTIETVKPLSRSIEVPIRYYSNDSLSQFLQMIISLKKNVLVIAHSNTILPMLDTLNLSHRITQISDSDYANLFIIEVKNNKAIGLRQTTYGIDHSYR